MRKLLVVIATALALLPNSAGAQTSGQPPTSAPPNAAARFADPMSAFAATLSASGKYVAYVERDETGERILVLDLAAQQSHVVQTIPKDDGEFTWLAWKGDERLVVGIFIHQHATNAASTGSRLGGSVQSYDISRVVSIDRNGGGLVQMFSGQLLQLAYDYGSTFRLDDLPNDPDHILIKAWDNGGAGAWRADVRTGHVERVADGTDETLRYVTDGNGVPVLRIDNIPDDSGYRVFRRGPGEQAWTFVLEARRLQASVHSPDFDPVGPGPGAGQVYVLARQGGADLESLYLYNTATGEFGPPVASGVSADEDEPWVSRRSHEIIATCEFAQRETCRATDQTVQRNLRALDSFFEHQATVRLVEMSDDGTKWLLAVEGPTQSGGYYIYDAALHSVSPVANAYPDVDAAALSPTDVVSYQARDGVRLWAYVTARPNASGPRPMVVFPHGGPEARDYFGFDTFVQYLAAQGYVVVQPNFRGSEGFGRGFANAGHGQWGLRMQDDLTDAVHHMVEAGVADPHRICIVGGSYGGYAALAGAALTPDLYRCAVSIAGVSDLLDMLRIESRTGRGAVDYQYWLNSIGDPSANRDALVAASPRWQASHITAPVLLIHGDQDHVVDIAQSVAMQDALQATGRPTQLIRIPGEGHIWDDWSSANRLRMYSAVSAFLATNLGSAQH